ncbi:MAG: DUF6252 family protein [Psychroflexus sp.]
MKNFMFLGLMALGLISCGDDIETNNPIIQGEVNGQVFRTDDVSATITNNDGLQISGRSLDRIRLRTSSSEVGMYYVEDAGNQARFTRDGEEYTASGEGAEGIIEIEKNEGGKVSGTVYFNAQIDGDEEVLNFSRGVFFGVPITNLTPEEPEVPEDEFNVTVNGENFNIIQLDPMNSNGAIVIVAGSQDGSIDLSFPENLEVGEYAFEENEDISGTYATIGSDPSDAATGILNIEETSETSISGTFSFTTENGDEIAGDFVIAL